MTKQWTLTQEAFDRLLRWLDPDPKQAGQKYEDIRSDLIRRFRYRGCTEAEDLADETINRVTRKLPEIEATYEGPREPYFYSVASYVYKEYLKKPNPIAPPPPPDPPDEKLFKCLEECLDKLDKDDHELILEYYRLSKQAKINLRRELAERYGITPDALRIRLFRMRRALRECIENCLKRAGFA